jgi:hypothetical protein
MPDVTVSTDVDNMLQAGTNEAIRTAIGSAAKVSPTITGTATFASGDQGSPPANIKLTDPQSYANQATSKCKILLETANTDQGSFELNGGKVKIGALNSGGSGGRGTFLSADVNAGPDYEVTINAGDGALSLQGDAGVKVGDDLHVASFGAGTDTTKVGIRTTTPSEALDVNGNAKVAGKITMPTANKALTKNNCYNKTGAVRLQRGATDSEEILFRYEGENSEDFVIQQWHGGNKEGQIKFQGDTPDGSNTVRLDAENIDVGFTGTVLTKIYSDTNVGANKKVVFTDTRDATDGLQFYHTGVRPNTNGEAGRDAIQMGMYGSYGDSNIGEFKITHKIGTASNTDVLSISPTADKVKIHKPLNLGNVPVFADNTAASSLATGDVYRTSTGVLMIKY